MANQVITRFLTFLKDPWPLTSWVLDAGFLEFLLLIDYYSFPLSSTVFILASGNCTSQLRRTHTLNSSATPLLPARNCCGLQELVTVPLGRLLPSSNHVRESPAIRWQFQRAQRHGSTPWMVGPGAPILPTNSCSHICLTLAQRAQFGKAPQGDATLCSSRAYSRNQFRNQSCMFKGLPPLHPRCWVNKRPSLCSWRNTLQSIYQGMSEINQLFQRPRGMWLEEFLCPQQFGGFTGQHFSKASFSIYYVTLGQGPNASVPQFLHL